MRGQQSIGDLFDELETAAAEDERSRVRQLIRRINEADPSLEELLDDLTTAIEDGEYEKAEVLLERLEQHYSEREPEERRRVEQSSLARSDPTLSADEREELHDHIREATAVELVRGATILDIVAYLEDPEIGEEEAVFSTIERLRVQEESLEQAHEQAEPIAREVTLPPKIRILSTEFDETTLELSVTVANLGNESATEVVIAVDERDDNGWAETVELGEMGADSEETVDLGLTTNREESYRVIIRVDSENAGIATESVTVDPSGELEDDDITDDISKWILVAAGAGALGAGGYGYLKYMEKNGDFQDDSPD